jgi:acetyl-CoA synthetase
MAAFESTGEIVWRPDAQWIAQSNLMAFMRRHGLSSLEELQHRSTTEISWFWDAILRDLDLQFFEPIRAWWMCLRGWPGRNGVWTAG